jgi:hypothetical protein
LREKGDQENEEKAGKGMQKKGGLERQGRKGDTG